MLSVRVLFFCNYCLSFFFASKKTQFISLLNFLCQCLCPYKENMTVMPCCHTTIFNLLKLRIKVTHVLFLLFVVICVLLLSCFVVCCCTQMLSRTEIKWWYVIYFRCCNKPHTHIHNEYSQFFSCFITFAVKWICENYTCPFVHTEKHRFLCSLVIHRIKFLLFDDF